MIDEENINSFGSRMKIINKYKDKNRIKIDVYFIDYDWTCIGTSYQHFKDGKIKCPYEPRTYNKGYIGIGKYIPTENKKAYSSWLNMFKRCYSDKTSARNSAYKKCEVCEEWHNFQNFCEWYYKHYYEIENQKMHLDKDILVKGNKIYSPKTCVFVPERINKLFETYKFKCNKEKGKYIVRIRKNGNNEYLGRFENKDKALESYKQAKEKYIKQVADEYKPYIPKKLYDAMYKYEVEITD